MGIRPAPLGNSDEYARAGGVQFFQAFQVFQVFQRLTEKGLSDFSQL
jgi:hypothetical protein